MRLGKEERRKRSQMGSLCAEPQLTGLEDVCEAVEHLQQIEYVARVTAAALPKQVQDAATQADNDQPVMQPNDLYPSQNLVFSTDLEGCLPPQADVRVCTLTSCTR